MTLLHYIGDHAIAVNFAHGNSKDSNKVHIRTCPSATATADGVPSNIYKNEIGKNTCTPLYKPVLKPRNSKQISNVQAKERQTIRLTHDAISGALRTGYSTKSVKMLFVRYLMNGKSNSVQTWKYSKTYVRDQPRPLLLSRDVITVVEAPQHKMQKRHL